MVVVDRKMFFFVSCVMAMLLLVAGCNRTVSVDSRWTDGGIVVDGQDNEWRDGGMFFDATTNTKIGIRNDAHDLYLCLVIKEENIERVILQGGFTLWVCRDKNKNKLWGLRYPVGGESVGDMSAPGGPDGGGPGSPEGGARSYVDGDIPSGEVDGNSKTDESKGRNGGGPPGEGQGRAGGAPGDQGDRAFASLNDFELLSSDDAPGRPIRTEELAGYGIEGRFSRRQGGGLIYEVKIPINKTEQTPFAAEPSRKGGYLIGLVSEKAENQGMGGDRSGGMGGGRGGGMGGMNFSEMGGGEMGGGGRGGGGRDGGEMGRGGMDGGSAASSIELWARIHLAIAPEI